MCCQITPAMGIPPMKPITTTFLRFTGTVLTADYADGERGLTKTPYSSARSFESGVDRFFTTMAGFPATTVFGATLLATTEPAATTEFSPMVTPFSMTAFIPIQTLSAMRTGAVRIGGRGG